VTIPVLLDIAAVDDRAEKPKNIEKKEPPRQAPEEDAPTGGTEESSSHESWITFTMVACQTRLSLTRFHSC